MLEFALRCLREEGAQIAEGYPVKATGKPIPAAFAFTGTTPLFKAAGFKLAGNKEGGKQRVRLAL